MKVLIVSLGSNLKYEYYKESNQLKIDRTPYNYAFIFNTSDDNSLDENSLDDKIILIPSDRIDLRSKYYNS